MEELLKDVERIHESHPNLQMDGLADALQDMHKELQQIRKNFND